MRIIDADALSEHKFVGNKFIQIGGRTNGKTLEAVNRAYQQGWNDAIDAIINNAPTVEQECYITGAQWDQFMKEHRRRTGAYDKIKTIIDGWAVDDDEHELLEQIADIIDEEAEDD